MFEIFLGLCAISGLPLWLIGLLLWPKTRNRQAEFLTHAQQKQLDWLSVLDDQQLSALVEKAYHHFGYMTESGSKALTDNDSRLTLQTRDKRVVVQIQHDAARVVVAEAVRQFHDFVQDQNA